MIRRITFFGIILTFAALILTSPAIAEPDSGDIEEQLPKLLGSSNQGTEFIVSFIPAWVEDRPLMDTNKVPGIRIYITSPEASVVKVRVEKWDWEKNIQILPNAVSEVFIPTNVAQPGIKTKDYEIPAPAQVVIGAAVSITATTPIVCYGMVRYPYTSDGYLALPISSLGKEYVVASYNGPTNDPSSQYLTSYTAVVGAYDNTTVVFTYGGNEGGWVETIGGKKLIPGSSDTAKLNKGDVWLIPARGNKPDITGSLVSADKPVACISGNFCSYIPIDKAACDHIIEQDVPTYLWGDKYYVTPIKNRLKNTIIRLFAATDNTTIYRNGLSEQVASIPKKSGPQNIGWTEIRAAEGDPQAVTLISNSKFNVVQYNTGQQDDGISSDPFQINVASTEQFLNHIAFATPGVKSGIKFDTNFVNLVYLATETRKIPDDLEFGYYGAADTIIWTKLSALFGDAPRA